MLKAGLMAAAAVGLGSIRIFHGPKKVGVPGHCMNHKSETVVITGASAGFGRADRLRIRKTWRSHRSDRSRQKGS